MKTCGNRAFSVLNKILTGAFFLFFTGWATLAPAGDPYSAYYSSAHNRLFWFIQISDTHIIGAPGEQESENLTWIITEGKTVIHPEFIVASGDLTDSTNGDGIMPDGPHIEEWQEYSEILSDAGINEINEINFFDIPGNHDHYNDKNFSYYLTHSLQGRFTGSTQVSWRKDFPFGSYHFIGINTAGNDGARFSIFPWDFFGDHAGMDAGELSFIETRLQENADADLTVIFGHHPLKYTGSDTDTYVRYGADELKSLMATYGVSMYAYGHTHQVKKELLPAVHSDGIFYLNASSLGRAGADHYNIIAIDCNGISVIAQDVNVWPAVLITAPLDINYGAAINPYGYSVGSVNPKPVRALVFDKNPVTRVSFRLDGSADWHPMTQVPGNLRLWEGVWQDTAMTQGEHSLEVEAVGSSTRSHVITVLDAYDISDVIAVLQVSAEITPAIPVNQDKDINGDARIGLAEAVYLLQEISGLR